MKVVNILYSFVFCLFLIQGAKAQVTEKRIFFPYFRATDSPTLSPLAHSQSQVRVHIDGLLARVKVRQIYENTTTQALHLTCVIPTDIDALQGSVAGKDGLNKPVIPKSAYTEAKQTVFVPVVPVAGKVELEWEYHILCEKEENVSMFRLPAFANVAEGSNVHYDLKVSFHTEYPLQDISSQEHLIEVHYPTANTAEVIFAKEEQQAGARPFLLAYKFYGSEVKITKNEEGVMRGAPKDDYTVTHEGRQDDLVSDSPTHHITQYYEVADKDYIEKIASKFGISVEDIKKWNHLKDHAHLHKGQKLKLEVPCIEILHAVEEDEYPYQIAQLYGVKVDELLEWNKLKNTDKLTIGQKIVIYQAKR